MSNEDQSRSPVSDPQKRSAEGLLRDMQAAMLGGKPHQAAMLGYLALQQSSQSDVIQPQVHLHLSKLMGVLGRAAFARIHARQALADAEKVLASEEHWPFYLRLGEVMGAAGDLVQAEYFHQLALDTLPVESEPSLGAGIHIALAELAFSGVQRGMILEEGEFDQLEVARGHLEQVLNILGDAELSLELKREIALLQAKLITHLSLATGEETPNQALAVAFQLLEQTLSNEADVFAEGKLEAMSTLMQIARANGQYKLAAELGMGALDLAEQRQQGHIDLVLGLALTAYGQKEPALLARVCNVLVNIEAANAAAVASMSSEAQALTYLDAEHYRSMICLHLLSQYAQQPQVADAMFDAVVRRKAIVFDAEGTFWRTTHHAVGQEFETVRDELLRLRRTLGHRLANRDATDLWSLIMGIQFLEEKLSVEPKLEALFSDPEKSAERDAVAAYAKSLLEGESNWDAATAHEQALSTPEFDTEVFRLQIPQNTSVIDFTRIRGFDVSREVFTDDAAYWALITTKGQPVRAVFLGEAAELEAAIQYATQNFRGADVFDAEGQTLALTQIYDLVWAPVAEYVKDKPNVYISADGVLATLPYAALYTPEHKFLIERYAIQYAANFRGIKFEADAGDPPANVYAFVNPSFGQFDKRHPSAGGSGLPSLPATQEEGNVLRDIYGERLTVFSDADVNEVELLKVDKADILHIATHGLFSKSDEWHLPTGVSIQDRLGTQIAFSRYATYATKSGLAVTGYNAGGVTESDDGYVSSFDIASMDLADTQLVVLSACDTGLGTFQVGEGILGLRRAFQIAGAKQVIMSLWQLQDKVAKRQVKQFYQAYDVSQNAVAAMRTMQIDQIERYRNMFEKEAPPLLWASWTIQVN